MKYSKPVKIVSPKIRKSAKGRRCTLRLPGICNHNPETTVLAHIHTKFSGMGCKSNDIHAFYCCSSCHSAYDRHEVDNIDVLGALVESQIIFYNEGLISVK